MRFPSSRCSRRSNSAALPSVDYAGRYWGWRNATGEAETFRSLHRVGGTSFLRDRNRYRNRDRLRLVRFRRPRLLLRRSSLVRLTGSALRPFGPTPFCVPGFLFHPVLSRRPEHHGEGAVFSRLPPVAVMMFSRGRGRYRYRGRCDLSGMLPMVREPHTHVVQAS